MTHQVQLPEGSNQTVEIMPGRSGVLCSCGRGRFPEYCCGASQQMTVPAAAPLQ